MADKHTKVTIPAIALGIAGSLLNGALADSPVNLKICDSSAVETARFLGKLTSNQSPWSSVTPKNFHFVLYPTDADSYTYGFTEGQLLSAGAKPVRCSEVNGLFKAPTALRIGEGNYNFAEPPAWDRTQSSSPFVSNDLLVLQAAAPVVLIKTNILLPPDAGLPPMSEAIARFAVHEIFHRYQAHHFVFPKETPDRTLEGCYKLSAWHSDILSEFKEWDALAPMLETAPPQQLLKGVASILARRTRPNLTPEEARCWEQVEAWERIEGMTHYFEIRASAQALAKPIDDTWVFVGNTLSSGFFDTYSFSREFYYITGARIGRILDRLDPADKWQDSVERGMSPAEVLRGFVSSGISHE